jgi:hypothetical protein
MNEPNQTIGRLLSRSAVELMLVTALVFATGWGGVRLAEAVHRHPVTPGRDGTIQLPIVKSDRRGDVSFEEGAGYKGWWHCQGGDWAVDWRLAAEPRRYRVETRLARSEPKTGARIAVVIGDQTLEAAVPETGGPAKWKALDLGVVLLDAKPCVLTVRPAGSGGDANVNLKSVTLRPEADLR